MVIRPVMQSGNSAMLGWGSSGGEREGDLAPQGVIRNLVLLVVVGATVTAFSYARDEGMAVRVILTDKTTLAGELLAVRPDAIVVARISGTSDEQLSEAPSVLCALLPLDRIVQVSTEGSSAVGVSTTIGVVLGIPIGAAFGVLLYTALAEPVNSFSRFEQVLGEGMASMLVGAAIGGVGGYFVGSSIGRNASEPPIIIVPSQGDKLERLRKYARYEVEEPEFVRSVLQKR